MVFASRSRRTRGAASLLGGVPGGRSRASSQPPRGGFAQAPLEAIFLRLCGHPCLAAECRQSLCRPCRGALALQRAPAVGMGSLAHGARSLRTATLLWAQPSPPSHSRFPVLHLARALLSRVPVATFPVYSSLAPLPLCRIRSSAEDLAVAAVPGSSLQSACATLAPSPSCPFCEAVRFSCRSLGLIPRMGDVCPCSSAELWLPAWGGCWLMPQAPAVRPGPAGVC